LKEKIVIIILCQTCSLRLMPLL